MSLELKLETAYAEVLKANEPTLAGVDIRLAHAVLEQTPPQVGSEDDIGKETFPSVTLTAKITGEAVPNSGVDEVDLMIETKDVAQREGSDGIRLDALFEASKRPLNYRWIHLMLTATGAGVSVLGMPDRHKDSGIEQAESTITRFISATFIASAI